jgi:hypothetical protein
MMIGEMENMWKEAIVAEFKVLSRHLPRGTEKKPVKSQSNSPSPGWDLNPGRPEYEAILLATRPWQSLGDDVDFCNMAWDSMYYFGWLECLEGTCRLHPQDGHISLEQRNWQDIQNVACNSQLRAAKYGYIFMGTAVYWTIKINQ